MKKEASHSSVMLVAPNSPEDPKLYVVSVRREEIRNYLYLRAILVKVNESFRILPNVDLRDLHRSVVSLLKIRRCRPMMNYNVHPPIFVELWLRVSDIPVFLSSSVTETQAFHLTSCRLLPTYNTYIPKSEKKFLNYFYLPSSFIISPQFNNRHL
jgi:hypothetical protein